MIIVLMDDQCFRGDLYLNKLNSRNSRQIEKYFVSKTDTHCIISGHYLLFQTLKSIDKQRIRFWHAIPYSHNDK